MIQIVELRASCRYVKEHPWVVQGITGFLSAYFIERPGFQVKKHFDELKTGIHVWGCDIPPDMKVPSLFKHLKEVFLPTNTPADQQSQPPVPNISLIV